MTATVEKMSRIRLAAWCVVAILFVLRATAVAVEMPWWIQVAVADTLTYLFPMLFVSVGSVYVALRRSTTLFDRRFWSLLSVSTFLLLVIETRWTIWVLTVDPRGPSVLIPDSLGMILAGILMVILGVSLSRVGSWPLFRRLRVYLDVGILFSATWPAVFLVWLYPLVSAEGGGAVDAALLSVRWILGAALVIVVIGMVTGLKSDRWRSWEALVAAALAVFGIGLLMAPWWYVDLLRRAVYTPSYFTDLLGVGLALMCMAIVYRLTTAAPPQDSQVVPRDWSVSSGVVRAYPVMAAFALPMLVYASFSGSSSAERSVVEIAAVLYAGLLASRSWLVTIERARARRDLMTDPVTGVTSGILFAERLRDALWVCRSEGRELSVVIFGVNGLDRVGDLYGHAETDRVLRRVASLIAEESPDETDLLRLNPDAFVAIIVGGGSSEAAAFGRRAWLSVTHSPATHQGVALELVVGVATYPTHVSDANDLLAAAQIAQAAAGGLESDPIVVFEESVSFLPPDEHVARARLRTLRLTVKALAEAVDARDPDTRDHSAHVAELATALAQFIALPDDRIQIVGLAALMHDVGKIAIQDEVLTKPGSLDPAERLSIEEHAVLGERILEPAGFDDIPRLVRWHHERWDGRGYPDGLFGEDIPVEARILAICDAFETITTGRTYQAALSTEAALDEISANAGSQFDPTIAAAFVRMIIGLGGIPAPKASGSERG